jgi:hypothetical protein
MRLVVACTFACAVSYGCAGDHDRLKKEEGGAGGAEGGMGGAGGIGGIGAGGSGGIIEPPGPPQLTVVNGIVDTSAVRLCFVPYPAGPGGEQPYPDGATGLGYARSAVIPVIEDLVPAGSDVEVYVIAGAIGATGGMSCADVLSDPPAAVTVRSVGVLPESSFSIEKSILVVTAGCVGGATHTHQNEELVCGVGYAPDAPTATMIAGFMSRLAEPDRLPLQFVQASLALGETQVQVRPGNGSVAQIAVQSWFIGGIAPYPPFMGFATGQLGSVGQTATEIYQTGGVQPVAAVPWSEAFAQSDLDEGDVSDGVGLAFVAVGPTPSLGEGPWWNAFTTTVVKADP